MADLHGTSTGSKTEHGTQQWQARKAGAIETGVRAYCDRATPRIRCLSEHNSRIKKHFTGSGRATKEDMVMRCRQRGWRPETADEADALALLDMAVVLFFVAPRTRKGKAA